MIVQKYNQLTDKPGFYLFAGEEKAYTLNDIDKIKADKKDLLSENEEDDKILQELEKQGRIKEETTMRPGFDR